MSVVAYRLLRDLRTAGTLSWHEAEVRVPDASALDDAVTWLHDRELVCIDQQGLAVS